MNEYNLTKAAYSIDDLLEIVPIGRTKIFAAVKNGALRATKYGRSTIFLAPDLVAFLESLREPSAVPNQRARS